MVLVSVLIPAYRAQKTIVRAVSSILRQSLQDWEIVIASDDQTDYVDYLSTFGIQDPRITQVFTGLVGSGESYARNKALEKAQGRFLAPLDADDEYTSKRLLSLVSVAESCGVATDNTAVYYTTEGKRAKRPFPNLKAMSCLTASDILMPRIPLFPVFHRDYIGGGWPVVSFAADVLFNLMLLCRVKEYRVVPHSWYRYYKNEGSITYSCDTVEIAERGYRDILRLLQDDRLLLRPEVRSEAYREFKENLILNGIFRRYMEAGRCVSLEEFLDWSANGRALWLREEFHEARWNFRMRD